MSAATEIYDTGEVETPAAVEQQVEQNSFQREVQGEEFPMPTPPVEAESTKESVPEAPAQESAQERNFKALTESVERLKAEREAEKREHQLQLDMLRANLAQGQRPQEQQPKKMFDGMEDGEIPNVGELRKAWEAREQAYNEKIEELQVVSSHPDYADVLTKYGKQLAETDPVFLQGLKGAENKALFAYQYAKRHQELQEKNQRIQELEAQLKQPTAPSQKSIDAQRMVENARKPGTLAQTGGQSVLSKADYYATMSDADFMKMASKHLESI
jgi:hypothetical protein